MKTRNTHLKTAGPRTVSTSAGLLIRLNTHRAAVIALFFAGAILLSTRAASAATITVNNTNDSGPGSLRQALVDANNGDTIDFDSSLKGQKITLTSGQLNVNKDVTINGPGANNLAVDGNAQSRVFYVNQTVTLSGLTIRNGYVANDSGGGIYNDDATLTITNCTLDGNSADYGGGILSVGGIGSIFGDGAALTVSNCTISGNHGGGIYNQAFGADPAPALATLTITNSILNGNYGGGIGNGAFIGVAEVAISNCTISSNYDTGISNASGGPNGGWYSTVTVNNSTLSGNSATGNGGGIYNVGGTGGHSTVTVNNSTVSGNSATGDGAGIYNVGEFRGGADVVVTNSTLSGNSTTGNGGGIYNNADRGGAQLAVTNSTFGGNSADHGGGIFNGTVNGVVTLAIGSTILSAGDSGENIYNDTNGTVASLGYNLSSDDGGGYLTANGDQINTDPLLGPLQDNGGPTFTHALLPGSPAINAGDPSFTPPPLYDQRGPGFDRVVNGRIDIGSFEVQAASTPTPTPTPTSKPSPRPSPTPRPHPTPLPRR